MTVQWGAPMPTGLPGISPERAAAAEAVWAEYEAVRAEEARLDAIWAESRQASYQAFLAWRPYHDRRWELFSRWVDLSQPDGEASDLTAS